MKININGLSIYYEAQGIGKPVILLHGWGTDSGSLRSISTLLKEQTESRVYSLDLPGFGYSDKLTSPWGVEDFVQILLFFLDEMKIENTSMIGHSFGGRIVIRFASKYPDRVDNIVLIDSAGIKPKRTVAYYLKIYIVKFLKYLVVIFPLLKNSKPFLVIFSKLGSDDYKNAGGMRETLIKVVNEDLRQYLPLIKSPTIIIWGEKDKATPLSDAIIMKDLIPNSRLEVIKNAGHFCYLENFDEFVRILLRFLRGER